MKLCRFTVLLALLFTGLYVNAQSIRLKTYLNATYANDAFSNGFNIAGISPAIAFVGANGNFHEAELSAINASSTHLETMGSTTKNYKLHLRYEYARRLCKKESKSQFYIGISASPYTDINAYQPGNSLSYPTRNYSYGLNLGFVPRYVYNVNERWAVDVNLPYDVMDFNSTVNVVKNPAFTPAQQRHTEFNFNMFESFFRMRAGVSVKL